MSGSPSFLDPYILPLIRGESVLDVACGYGKWGHLIYCGYYEAGLEQPPRIEGLDAFQENVDFCSRHQCYSRVWQQVMPSPLEGQWDTVLAPEFIEHLPEEQIEEAVTILERAARKRVIFTTPNMPALRDGHDTLVGFNKYEAHLSYVPRSWFTKRGYRLIGAGWGNHTHLFVKVVRRLHLPFESGLHSLPTVFPSLGKQVIAVKDME